MYATSAAVHSYVCEDCACLWQDALLAEGAVQELVACIVRAADRPMAEYAASALLVLSHNHPGACFQVFVCLKHVLPCWSQ